MSSINNLFDVNGKVVIVTGANRGNGLAISEALSELGAKVIRVDKKFDGHYSQHCNDIFHVMY